MGAPTVTSTEHTVRSAVLISVTLLRSYALRLLVAPRHNRLSEQENEGEDDTPRCPAYTDNIMDLAEAAGLRTSSRTPMILPIPCMHKTRL